VTSLQRNPGLKEKEESRISGLAKGKKNSKWQLWLELLAATKKMATSLKKKKKKKTDQVR